MKITKKLLFLCLFISFALGLGTAVSISSRPAHVSQIETQQLQLLPSSDILTFSKDGDIYQITSAGLRQITHGQQVIEPIPATQNFIAVEKQKNYSSLLMFDATGQMIKTLLNGNAAQIEQMHWVTDPAISPDQTLIAYASDQDQAQLNMSDNALFIQSLATGMATSSSSSQLVVKPILYSGGIAHPVWDPAQPQLLLYDSYQYDAQTKEPYSAIYIHDFQTNKDIQLTTEEQNAFQAAFSPDGKKLLFLQRNKEQNTVSLYLADFSANQLSQPQLILTGDLAYPEFSYTPNHIYYLQATHNSDYTLYQATLNEKTHGLENVSPVTGGTQLKANSAFAVTEKSSP